MVRNKINFKRLLLMTILVIVILMFLSLACKSIFINDYLENECACDMNDHGLEVIHDVLDKNEIEYFKKLATEEKYKDIKKYIINSDKIKERIISRLGNGYQFQDYIFMITKSNIHTCHRDYNGDFFNEGQKHKSYTILFYLEEMDRCLDVIPGSHKEINTNSYNLSDPSKSIRCRPGSAVLFDANLIHTGSFNKKTNNMRFHMKLKNNDDFYKLQYYENYNKVTGKEATLPVSVRKIQKHFSCQFPVLGNVTQNSSIETTKSGELPIYQRIFSLFAYGDSNFYKLKEAFGLVKIQRS